MVCEFLSGWASTRMWNEIKCWKLARMERRSGESEKRICGHSLPHKRPRFEDLYGIWSCAVYSWSRDAFMWRVVCCAMLTAQISIKIQVQWRKLVSFLITFFVFIDITSKHMSENKIYTRKAQKKSIHFIYIFFLLLCTHTLRWFVCEPASTFWVGEQKNIIMWAGEKTTSNSVKAKTPRIRDQRLSSFEVE